jgi:hypothetical protein
MHGPLPKEELLALQLGLLLRLRLRGSDSLSAASTALRQQREPALRQRSPDLRLQSAEIRAW